MGGTTWAQPPRQPPLPPHLIRDRPMPGSRRRRLAGQSVSQYKVTLSRYVVRTTTRPYKFCTTVLQKYRLGICTFLYHNRPVFARPNGSLEDALHPPALPAHVSQYRLSSVRSSDAQLPFGLQSASEAWGHVDTSRGDPRSELSSSVQRI